MLISREGISLIVWLVVFFTIITLILALRFEAARTKKRSIRVDDYLIIVTYISLLVLDGLTYWAVTNGLGAHIQELDKNELAALEKTLLGTALSWLSATIFCKLAILWFYTCIFTTKRFRIAAWTLMAIVAGFGVSFLCVFLTNCQPISYSWDPVQGGSCKSTTVEEIVSVSINMVLDTSVVILPMPPLWGLQMPTRKKVAISGLFGLGLMVVAVMGWRVQISVQSATQTDFAYGLGNLALVTHLEIWLGVIVACLPTLAPLVSKYLRPAFSRFSSLRKKPRAERQLREAKHTIGSSQSHRFDKKSFSRMDTDRFLELEEGVAFARNEATASARSTAEENAAWETGSKSIGVRHDILVHGETPAQ